MKLMFINNTKCYNKRIICTKKLSIRTIAFINIVLKYNFYVIFPKSLKIVALNFIYIK